jgi:ribosomal protein S18 acetylase RimI-like enzyme
MRSEEFGVYLEYFIRAYAREISENFGLSDAAATARAKREIEKDLPAGLDTRNQVLLCIVDAQQPNDAIGYLWYKPDDQSRHAFICDFHVMPTHRGSGYGTRALAVLEADLKEVGFKEIGLRVAANNRRAQRLYRSSGFLTTGFNMGKQIR